MISTNYEGLPYIWLIGIPIVVLVILMRREYRYDLLMINSQKYDSLNQAIAQLTYLNKMLNFYYQDNNIASLLDGLVEYHQSYCKLESCPVNTRNVNTKRVRKFMKNFKNDRETTITQKYVILIFLIERTYVIALTRYP